jgi:hypothetical protein
MRTSPPRNPSQRGRYQDPPRSKFNDSLACPPRPTGIRFSPFASLRLCMSPFVSFARAFAASREAFRAPGRLWLTRRREDAKRNRAGTQVCGCTHPGAGLARNRPKPQTSDTFLRALRGFACDIPCPVQALAHAKTRRREEEPSRHTGLRMHDPQGQNRAKPA